MHRNALLALLATFALSTSALGQGYHRQGVWFGAGLGYGTTSGEDTGNESGPAAYLRVGGTVSQDFLLGGEALGWYWSSGDEELLRTSLSLVMVFYPLRRADLILKGAAGFAHAESKRPSPVGGGILEVVRHDGFAMSLGVAYDVRVATTLSITPGVEVVANNFDGFNLGLALLTVGVTWH